MITTVNSLSGGKTSSYMAIHYPADLNIFSLVLIDHQPSAPKDKGLIREIKARIPHFIATPEDDLTLINLLKLEQKIGKEIIWVSSKYTLDDFIYGETDIPGYRTGKMYLPNFSTRFCTIRGKIFPIFEELYYMGEDFPVMMNIGFRVDESKRVYNWKCSNDRIKYPIKKIKKIIYTMK